MRDEQQIPPAPHTGQPVDLAEANAREDRADRSTVLRQLMYAGAEEYAGELLAKERISVSKAAELLDSSVHRVRLLARERGLETGSTPAEHEKAVETARGLR
ncbi:MAG: hypothetical protein AVDCRST_MAG01-01-4809 [uncultured Rubrobacteraceae bacterium]|uniref:Uncharacterized protein n=1 Tax=uncultured Rubrobacteraceae bacterium TaxID=349277 RepID=A0A6J4QY59_9ACTN|nr:MAG: hypothetical protein AVDCRST_MAG01-01-4809 [uncultured Rubrobacteraceae bacterium]